MKIHNEKSGNGGTAWVTCAEGSARVFYTHSNPRQPLSMRCAVVKASAPNLAVALIEGLTQLHSPTVLVVESEATEIRYTPKIASSFRCWTHGNQSVFAEAFSSRDVFNRVCSLSCAMQNTDFVRVKGDEVQLYGYHAVLGKIRESTMPFEFLSIKEECDYSIKGASANCVERIVEAAEGALPHLSGGWADRFSAALCAIQEQQGSERGFGTRYSYIQEVVTAVLLPAVVRFGSTHPFTRAVFSEFSQSASAYVGACEAFLSEHREIDGMIS